MMCSILEIFWLDVMNWETEKKAYMLLEMVKLYADINLNQWESI